MKKLLFTVLLVLLVSSLTAQTVTQATVAVAGTTVKAYEGVIVEGKVTAQVRRDEYTLEDSTGTIVIDLKNSAKKQLKLSGQSLQGATVRAYGIVERETKQPVEINVYMIEIVKPAAPISK